MDRVERKGHSTAERRAERKSTRDQRRGQAQAECRGASAGRAQGTVQSAMRQRNRVAQSAERNACRLRKWDQGNPLAPTMHRLLPGSWQANQTLGKFSYQPSTRVRVVGALGRETSLLSILAGYIRSAMPQPPSRRTCFSPSVSSHLIDLTHGSGALGQTRSILLCTFRSHSLLIYYTSNVLASPLLST